MRAAGESNTGRRRHNEDSFCCRLSPDGVLLAAAADGVGGNSQGEIASRAVCRALLSGFIRGAEGGAEAFLRSALTEVNAELFSASRAKKLPHPSASTAAAAVFGAESVTLTWVGDSPVFEITPDGKVQELTEAHTYDNAYLRSHGAPPPDSSNSHRIFRAVGNRAVLPIEIITLPRRPDSRFLICTDGVSGALAAPKIADIMLNAESPRAAAGGLVVAALVAGSTDNMTAVAVFP